MKSKGQILKMIEKFLNGASESEVQLALNEMGMGPDQVSGLSETRDLFSRNDKAIQLTLSNKKLATREKNEARAHVCALVSNMARIIKLIEPNSSYLSALQLETRYKTSYEAGSNDGDVAPSPIRKAVSAAKSDGELQVYLDGILANLPGMPEKLRREMALFGWDDAANQRLIAAVMAFQDRFEARERLKRGYHQQVADNQKVWRRLIQLFRAYNGNVKCQMKAFPHVSAKLKLMTGTLNSPPAKPKSTPESIGVVDVKHSHLPADDASAPQGELEIISQARGGDTHDLNERSVYQTSRMKMAPVWSPGMRRKRSKHGGLFRSKGAPPGRRRLV